jgi:hypothetical protein
VAIIKLKLGRTGAEEWVNTTSIVRFQDVKGAGSHVWFAAGDKGGPRVYLETAAQIAELIAQASPG